MRLDRRTARVVPPRLFHYTAGFHLGSIVTEKTLRTSESNIDISGAGPRVVWLTDADSDQHGWAAGGGKGQVRITVGTGGLPIFWWPEWSRAQGIEEFWYNALAASGGDPETWWVCTEPIGAEFWTDFEVWRDGGFQSMRDQSPIDSLLGGL